MVVRRVLLASEDKLLSMDVEMLQLEVYMEPMRNAEPKVFEDETAAFAYIRSLWPSAFIVHWDECLYNEDSISVEFAESSAAYLSGDLGNDHADFARGRIDWYFRRPIP